MRRTLAILAFVLASSALFAYSFQKGAPFGWVEAIGFITGALCVWLTIYENVWNFPIGIANCVFLGLLFLEQRLFADAGLQVMFILLGVQGWWLWLYGGARTRRQHATEIVEVNPPVRYPHSEGPAGGSELHVSRADRRDLWQGVAFTLVTLPLFTWYLIRKEDAAPFWDALITILSVVAQVLLNRKRIENWWVWLAVDIVSVGLYVAKHIYLTSVLYALYCGMAFMGFLAWQKALAQEPAPV